MLHTLATDWTAADRAMCCFLGIYSLWVVSSPIHYNSTVRLGSHGTILKGSNNVPTLLIVHTHYAVCMHGLAIYWCRCTSNSILWYRWQYHEIEVHVQQTKQPHWWLRERAYSLMSEGFLLDNDAEGTKCMTVCGWRFMICSHTDVQIFQLLKYGSTYLNGLVSATCACIV